MERDSTTGRFLKRGQVAERFAANYIERDSGCWEWTAGLTGAGYGAFYPESRQVGAHLWAYEQTYGRVPQGLVVDHMCGNRACVNPEHLRAIGRGANVLASSKSRAGENMRKTHCLNGHALAGDNLIIKPNARNPDLRPWRQCRTCENQRKRARRARAV